VLPVLYRLSGIDSIHQSLPRNQVGWAITLATLDIPRLLVTR
jgi:hypothetical protein